MIVGNRTPQMGGVWGYVKKGAKAVGKGAKAVGKGAKAVGKAGYAAAGAAARGDYQGAAEAAYGSLKGKKKGKADTGTALSPAAKPSIPWVPIGIGGAALLGVLMLSKRKGGGS